MFRLYTCFICYYIRQIAKRAVLRYPLSLQIAPLYSSLVRSSSLHCTKLSDSLYTLPVGRDIEWKQWSGPKPIDLYAEVLDVKSTRIWVLCCCTILFFFIRKQITKYCLTWAERLLLFFLRKRSPFLVYHTCLTFSSWTLKQENAVYIYLRIHWCMSPLTIMMLFIGTPFSSKTQTSMLSLRTIRSRKQLLEKKPYRCWCKCNLCGWCFLIGLF